MCRALPLIPGRRSFFTSGCCRPRVVHSHYLHSSLQGERKPWHWEAQPGVPLAVLGRRQPGRQQGSAAQEVGREWSPWGGRRHRRGQQPRHKHHAHRSGPQQTSGGRVAPRFAHKRTTGERRAERGERRGGRGDGGGGAGRAADDCARHRHSNAAGEVQEEGGQGGLEGGRAGGGQGLHQHGAHAGGEDARLPQQLGGLSSRGRQCARGQWAAKWPEGFFFFFGLFLFLSLLKKVVLSSWRKERSDNVVPVLWGNARHGVPSSAQRSADTRCRHLTLQQGSAAPFPFSLSLALRC